MFGKYSLLILSLLFFVSCGKNLHYTGSTSSISSLPIAGLALKDGVSLDNQCINLKSGFLNTISQFHTTCVTDDQKFFRYNVYLTPDAGVKTLIASYPSFNSFSSGDSSFAAAGTLGTYLDVTINDWQLFLGQSFNYNDEICVEQIVKNCVSGGETESLPSAHSCFKWFGKEVFSYTGAPVNISQFSVAPTKVYGKIWGAAGGGGQRSAGGAGGFTYFKGDYFNDLVIFVGRGGFSRANHPGADVLLTGGMGGNGTAKGGTGGDLSGIFLNGSMIFLNSYAIAGGGGGSGFGSNSAGSSRRGNGGNGGGLEGTTGGQGLLLEGGTGGTQISGGVPNVTIPLGDATAGSQLKGGQGHAASNSPGGGGGGYFGGAGGNMFAVIGKDDTGGGGGSGFLNGTVDSACSGFGVTPPTSTIYSTVIGSPGILPPSSSDIDYVTNTAQPFFYENGGDGLIVIYYIP